MAEKNLHLASIKKRIMNVPNLPGVYRWFDTEGKVLYVGKAKDLKKRLLSYVQGGKKRSMWTEIMLTKAKDIDCTVTRTELEALLLETNLIKDLQPKFNIMMKDDKNHVYIRISKEPYPRIDVVRRMEEDGAQYFGPKTSAEQVRESLSFLRTLFPFRTCKMQIVPPNDPSELSRIPLSIECIDRDRPTPCLDYHIKQCIGPCIGTVTPAAYEEQCIAGVRSFFQGKYQDIEKLLLRTMQEAAQGKKFEKAAKLRDHLTTIRAMSEKQVISGTTGEDADIIGIAILSGRASVVVLCERDGKICEERSFSLKGSAYSSAEVLAQFLPQYYEGVADLPREIFLPETFEDADLLQSWLSERSKKTVKIILPERGRKSQLLLLAEKNAIWKAEQEEAKWESETRKVEDALSGLQQLLSLPNPPKRIEGYDISHTGGMQTVGSMVVFEHGKPKREHYRSFDIHSLSAGAVDDYASLKEVLSRRVKYIASSVKKEELRWKEKGYSLEKMKKADLDAVRKLGKFKKTQELDISHSWIVKYKEKIVAAGIVVAIDGKDLLMGPFIAKNVPDDLSQFLVHALLRRRHEKLYAEILESKESWFAACGFRHVLKAPKEFGILKKGSILVMYDPKQHGPDASFDAVPDLLLIDGGKGQLGVVTNVLSTFDCEVPIASIAKEQEEIFIPGQSAPLFLSKDAPAQFLLQRIRDEAHRFANSRREKKAKNDMLTSSLDSIAGLGAVTTKKLFTAFGSLDGIKSASDEVLLRIISSDQLRSLRQHIPPLES